MFSTTPLSLHEPCENDRLKIFVAELFLMDCCLTRLFYGISHLPVNLDEIGETVRGARFQEKAAL